MVFTGIRTTQAYRIVFAVSALNGSQQLLNNHDYKVLWQYADRLLAAYNFKKSGPAEDTHGF